MTPFASPRVTAKLLIPPAIPVTFIPALIWLAITVMSKLLKKALFIAVVLVAAGEPYNMSMLNKRMASTPTTSTSITFNMNKLLLVIAPKQARVPQSVVKMFVTVLSDLGILMVGSVALPFLFDTGSFTMILSGVILALVLWSAGAIL